MTSVSNQKVVSQSVFRDAVKARDPRPLVHHLGALPLDQERVDQLASFVRRSRSLIQQRPDATSKRERDTFLADVRTHLAQSGDNLDLALFDEAVRTIAIAEDGFHRILAFFERTEFAGRPGDVRAAAVIEHMEATLDALKADMEAQLRSASGFSMPGGIPFVDDAGRPASGDAALSGMVNSLGGTLLMEGYANDWFDRSRGWLILPALPSIDRSDVLLAGQSEFLSTAWSRWARLCDTARFWDSPIRELRGQQLPQGCNEQIDLVYARESDCWTVDYVANERAVDREGVNAVRLQLETSVSELARGIDGPVPPAPAGWVSSEEAQNVLALSEVVGYEVLEDLERPGGLRLAQWVRGFALLSAWVSHRSADGGAGVLHIAEADLQALLERGALSVSEARTFMNAASFGRRSRDLFDTPIVRTAGDWLLVGAPLAAPRLSKIIPSLLASMGVQLKRKGGAFEWRVLELLKENGLDARTVKATRDGAEYEYDVLFPWGNYVFHLECKNHGLSGNDPVAAYHFLQEVVSGVRQVQRLRGALDCWPEILTDAFGPEVAGRTVVSCILQNEPYCVPGGIEGIYVCDWSALGRFFENGWLRVIHDHRMPMNTVLRAPIGIKQIWSGEDKPTPEDLIAQLEAPPQFSIAAHHLELRQASFQLDETTVATDWLLFRNPVTTAGMAEALGVSPQVVAARIAEADAQIGALRLRLAGEGIT